MSLREKIEARSAVVAVAGLGYVGLPLAEAAAEAGFQVVGIDLDLERVEAVNAGHGANRLSASTSYEKVSGADVVVICVPTPLDHNRDPDLSIVRAAVAEIAGRLERAPLVVLESTTYPGTTEEEVLPRLSAGGREVGRDFHLAFSPERIDPASKTHDIRTTGKVVGGVTAECTSLAAAFYATFIDQVVPVSSTRVAEMTKLLENIYRSVNIALVNELLLLCERMDIDIWEVIEAAKTKPFGFKAFYPGPGIGGHCIPVDPFYLSWKAREYGFHAEFIEHSGKVNEDMTIFVVDKVFDVLNEGRLPVKGTKIAVLGVAYKKDLADVRESAALKAMKQLAKAGAELVYHDPLVAEVRLSETVLSSVPLEKALDGASLALIITDHSEVDYQCVVDSVPFVLDTRNVTRGLKGKARVYIMGGGWR